MKEKQDELEKQSIALTNERDELMEKVNTLNAEQKNL